jgi:glycosyltransferase involved in cell wall biosynthesis
VRVLHLCAGNLFGGIETMLVTLARERGQCPAMEPAFGVCFEGRLNRELRGCGAVVHSLGSVRLSRPWTVWRARRRLRALLTRDRYDVAVCHECWPHVLFAPVLRRCGVPAAFFAHAGHDGSHWLERWAARTQPEVVIANSRWTQSQLGRLFPRVASEVVHPPVAPPPPEDWAAARRDVRAELGTPGDAVVIAQVSRLERWKGHLLLLDALRRLMDVPGWECWIVGGAQRSAEEVYLAEVRDRAAALGQRVRFLGQRPDVPRLLAAADIYCQANTGPEPFGIALVEALYAGLPVVTAEHGGALEIVNPTCGVLAPPGNTEAVTRALKSLVRDAERRRALGVAGLESAAMHFGGGRSLAAMGEILGSLCQREAVA